MTSFRRRQQQNVGKSEKRNILMLGIFSHINLAFLSSSSFSLHWHGFVNNSCWSVMTIMTGLWMKYNLKRTRQSWRCKNFKNSFKFFKKNISFIFRPSLVYAWNKNNWNISLSSMAALESIFHNLDDVYDGGRNIKTILTSLLTLQLSDKTEEFSEISSLSFPIHKHYIIKSHSVSFSSRLWCHHKFPMKIDFYASDGGEFLLFIPKLHETCHAMDHFFSSCAATVGITFHDEDY